MADANRRSMEVDSELKIHYERMDVTQPLRRHLWNIHTGGERNGASDDSKLAAAAWKYIITQNARREKNGDAPLASPVGFMWTGASRLQPD